MLDDDELPSDYEEAILGQPHELEPDFGDILELPSDDGHGLEPLTSGEVVQHLEPAQFEQHQQPLTPEEILVQEIDTYMEHNDEVNAGKSFEELEKILQGINCKS